MVSIFGYSPTGVTRIYTTQTHLENVEFIHFSLVNKVSF